MGLIRLPAMMAVPMIVAHCPAMAVGPTAGCEWADKGAQRRPQPGQHVVHDLVLPDDDPVWFDLARGMSIADMPGQLDQWASDLQQLFGGGLDRDQAAIGQNKGVALIHADRLGKIGQDCRTGHGQQPFAADQAVFVT